MWFKKTSKTTFSYHFSSCDLKSFADQIDQDVFSFGLELGNVSLVDNSYIVSFSPGLLHLFSELPVFIEAPPKEITYGGSYSKPWLFSRLVQYPSGKLIAIRSKAGLLLGLGEIQKIKDKATLKIVLDVGVYLRSFEEVNTKKAKREKKFTSNKKSSRKHHKKR
ncbi:MAG: hypothetical protein ACTSYA_06185 [Candidatus Kariarchaeaceae archaeon]